MSQSDEEIIQAGSAEFKTVKAGCGIRFDLDILNEDAGFDFSGADKLKSAEDKSTDKEETKK